MSTNADDFFSRAKERLQKLSADINQLERQEEGVRRRRIEYQKQAEEWVRAIALYAEAMEVDEPSPPPGQLLAGLDAPKGTIPQLTDQYLSEHDGIGRIADVVRWLIETGRLPDDPRRAQRQYGQVYTGVIRHPDRFEYVDRGVFRLREGSHELRRPRSSSSSR